VASVVLDDANTLVGSTIYWLLSWGRGNEIQCYLVIQKLVVGMRGMVVFTVFISSVRLWRRWLNHFVF
jgi:hypothetical protein